MPKKPDKLPEEVKNYLAAIGRKGGKKPNPHKKYNNNAERQKAYRNRKKEGESK